MIFRNKIPRLHALSSSASLSFNVYNIRFFQGSYLNKSSKANYNNNLSLSLVINNKNFNANVDMYVTYLENFVKVYDGFIIDLKDDDSSDYKAFLNKLDYKVEIIKELGFK